MKKSYVGENLGEDKIKDVRFEDLEEDVPVELEKYIRNYVVEEYGRKGPLKE